VSTVYDDAEQRRESTIVGVLVGYSDGALRYDDAVNRINEAYQRYDKDTSRDGQRLYTAPLTLRADQLDTPAGGPLWQVRDGSDETTWHDLTGVAACEDPNCVVAGVPVPFDPGTGPVTGYVAGDCGHRVAESEWQAGFRVCERCPAVVPPECVVLVSTAWADGSAHCPPDWDVTVRIPCEVTA
jgi:hypothetical protein